MKISRSTHSTNVFVLSWESFEKIYYAIKSHLPIITISTKCADQHERKFNSIDELKSFDNPARAAIIELHIVGRDDDYKQKFSLSMSNEQQSNVWISLDANEESGLALSTFTNDTIESLKPWYSWVAKADWYWFAVWGWLAIQLLLLILKLALAGKSIINFSLTTPTTARELLISIVIGFTPLAVGFFLNLIRNNFFPTGVFSFGQGALRHSSNEVTRTVLIAGLAVSVVTSVALSLFN